MTKTYYMAIAVTTVLDVGKGVSLDLRTSPCNAIGMMPVYESMEKLKRDFAGKIVSVKEVVADLDTNMDDENKGGDQGKIISP